MPGRQSTMVKLRDASVPVTKWPTVGMTLPVEVSPRNPRQLRVRWELMDAHTLRTASPMEADEAFAVPIFTDYSDKELEGLTGDLPTAVIPAVTPDVPPPRVPAELDELDELDEYFPPSDDYLLPGQDADPDTILGDEIIIPPHLSADLSPEASARSSDFELPMRNIPQPRPAERPSERRGVEPPGGQSVTEHGSDVNGQAMGMMLVVSDLNRSLRFYRDLVGFSVVDRGANVAVLAYGGGRVLLRQLADMSPVDRRVAHLHISVSDVDASYKDLKDRGIEFVHRPRVTSRGEKLDLWAAIFRDPDGHDIALTQWRAREDAPPQA
jgi:catechol 2,3-dioxygenase-like lactoylglutathione lyase family enzyme